MTPRLARLLDAVADRPEGQKVSIPALIRQFTPTQAETIAAIHHLIDIGMLDGKTLRRPARECGEGGRGESVPPLTQQGAATTGKSKRMASGNVAKQHSNPPRPDALEDRTPELITQETPAQENPASEPTEPPEPQAEAEGGGDHARNAEAPPPIDLDQLLACFGDEFETLRVIAQRYGASSPQKIVRHARMLHERGLVEQSPPVNGQPFLLWRRTQQNTRGASGAHGGGRERAPESGLANGPTQQRKRRTPDTAASTVSARQWEETPRSVGCDEEPGGEAKPILREAGLTPPVDIKVNAPPRRDPTQPPPGYGEGSRSFVLPGAQQGSRSSNWARTKALARIEKGLPANLEEGVQVKLQQEQIMRERAETARLADPIERAKITIRSKGRLRCFNADVSIGEEGRGKFFIGNRLVDEVELLAFAKRLAA